MKENEFNEKSVQIERLKDIAKSCDEVFSSHYNSQNQDWKDRFDRFLIDIQEANKKINDGDMVNLDNMEKMLASFMEDLKNQGGVS